MRRPGLLRRATPVARRTGLSLRATPVVVAIVCGACSTAVSGPARGVVRGVVPGTSAVVVVAEGQLEPQSVGSYSLIIYGGANPRFPHDDFVTGLVRPRDGTVEGLIFSDVDGDGTSDIVVIMRSAGTGGYRSADAFRLHDTTLSLVESVKGLPKDGDPVHALRAKVGAHAAPQSDQRRR
jgi:hypothetical protein